LVEAFGDAEPTDSVPPLPSVAVPERRPPIAGEPAPVAPTTAGEPAPPVGIPHDVILPYLPFLRAVEAGDATGQKAAARDLGKPAEVIADEINELAAEYAEDILLEENGAAYAVIEDYRELLEQLIHEA
jgi:hypothetical protein